MNIYKLSQTEVNDYGTFDSAVVIAENEEKARKIHPNKNVTIIDDKWQHNEHKGEKWYEELPEDEKKQFIHEAGEWVSYKNRDKIKVEIIGISIKKESQIITASYNAG